MLATQGWEKIVEAGELLEAIDRLVLRFGVPLRKANVQAAEVTSEFRNMHASIFHSLPSSIMLYGGVFSMRLTRLNGKIYSLL